MGLLKYIDFISGSGFYSGGFQRTTSHNYFRYVGVGKDYDTVYDVSNTGLTVHTVGGILGTPTTYVGFNQRGGGGYQLGGEYTDQITLTISDTYVTNLTIGSLHDDYLGYHAVHKLNIPFQGTYILYVISDTNKSGIVSYEETYDHSSGGVNYFNLTYVDKLDYTSTLSNPGTQLNANSLILVNNYIIGGFSDVGLMSFSIANDGTPTQEDRISGGTNNYVQAVANYGNYIYFTSAGSNADALQRCELTAGGTFSGLTTIVDTGTTAGGIAVKGNILYYGTQMELHRYEINSNNGNLTHLQTYDLSTTYFTSAIIRSINIDIDTDYMVLETSEGRAFILEEGDPIPAGSKNRVIFMM